MQSMILCCPKTAYVGQSKRLHIKKQLILFSEQEASSLVYEVTSMSQLQSKSESKQQYQRNPIITDIDAKIIQSYFNEGLTYKQIKQIMPTKDIRNHYVSLLNRFSSVFNKEESSIHKEFKQQFDVLDDLEWQLKKQYESFFKRMEK